MSKGAVVALVVGGAVLLVGGIAYAASPSAASLRPALPPPPPPPPPSLNQTIYQAGADATKLGLSVYEKATGSKLTGKDVALTVATGGIYPQAKAVGHFLGSLF